MSYADELQSIHFLSPGIRDERERTAKLAREADAEIAALREALENAQARGIHTCHDRCQRIECVQRRKIDALERELKRSCEFHERLADERDALRAENKRLRELLKEADIARRALLEQKPRTNSGALGNDRTA